MSFFRNILRNFQSPRLWRLTIALSLIATLPSCSLVQEDLEPCPNPQVELRFIYDYNMNRANAFHSQVDCLSVYFFNEKGELIKVETVTDREILADEDYRMRPELPAGEYHVIAYGGMDCENASFYRVGNLPLGTHFSNLRVQLDPVALINKDKSRLHNHFYGSADFEVSETEDTRAVVPMMRNTNSIQVALQNENTHEPIDHKDFIFEITDDNNDFSFDNSLIPTGEITYIPWKKENRSTLNTPEGEEGEEGESNGENKDNGVSPEDGLYAAITQFTTSRLVLANREMKPTATRLTIRRADNGDTIFSIPLVNYMLMFKHDNTGAGLDDMGDQEYLDRENTWNFVFFIKDGMWVDTHIIINDWEVRMNSAGF